MSCVEELRKIVFMMPKTLSRLGKIRRENDSQRKISLRLLTLMIDTIGEEE